MIKNLLFDLDGTMLPMDYDDFIKLYFGAFCNRFCTVLEISSDKLVNAIWGGTKAMMKGGDGVTTARERFWQEFESLSGLSAELHEAEFADFYRHEFEVAKGSTWINPKVPELIHALKEKGVNMIAATNPIFPYVATEKRLGWAGLSPKLFSYISTYENSKFCKPDPRYFLELLEKNGLKAEECLMIGNDATEDTAALKAGIDVFLISDCLVHENENTSSFPQGNFDDLKTFLEGKI